MLTEERKQSQEVVKQSVAATREEMKEYLKEQRKVSVHLLLNLSIGPRSAVGNVSGYRCVSDCRSRGPEFDPSPIPYFRGD